MTDDGGVLGNLPRSRPGRRSEKRDAKATTPRRAQAAARPKPAAPPRPAPQPRGGDLVGDALRTATGIAATGARLAGGVTREVLRRLRP